MQISYTETSLRHLQNVRNFKNYLYFGVVIQPRLLLFVLFFFPLHSIGQSIDTIERIPESLLNSNPETFFEKAIEFSKTSDSIQVSANFMKLDPHFLLWKSLKFTGSDYVIPYALDSFYRDLNITSAARIAYTKRFDSVFYDKKTTAYNDFWKMYVEDQTIRTKLGACNDSFTCMILERKMNAMDSVHFFYLNNYIKTNGWPSLENGSLAAELIAIHNHKDYDYYIPLLKKAAIEGKVSTNAYYTMLMYKKSGEWNLDKLLALTNKFYFDITPALNGKMPARALIDRMIDSISVHCPILHMMVLLESNVLGESNSLIGSDKSTPFGKVQWYYLNIFGSDLNGGKSDYSRCSKIQGIEFRQKKILQKRKKLKLYFFY